MKFLQKALPTLLLISGIMIHANGQAIILISEFVPCANGGAGEIVEGELTADIISAPGRNSTGPYILRVAGVLYGSESTYPWYASHIDLNGNFNKTNGANTETTLERLQFVGDGTVFIMSLIIHITSKDGNNPVLVEIEHNMEKCLTKDFRN
jgi:hypothetical protein